MSNHIVIIGAGVVGLCSAYYCARAGHRVTVIESDAALRDGCSYGNAGLVCPSHFIPLASPGMVETGLKMMANPRSPFYIKPRLSMNLLRWAWRFYKSCSDENVTRASPVLRDLSLLSRSLYEEFAVIPGLEFGLEKRGLIMVCKEARTLEHETHFVETANRFGLPAHLLSAGQIQSLNPGLALDIAGGVHFPGDYHITPGRFMAAIQEHLQTLGVQFRFNTSAKSFNLAARRIQSVETSSGPVDADQFVLAAGSWTPTLTKPLGLKLLMEPGKGYSLTLPSPPQIPSLPLIFTEARLAVTPMGNSLRFAGTMEIAGLDTRINPTRVDGIIQSIPKYLPDFAPSHFSDIKPWAGLRPVSPDGLPYLGRPACAENLVIATGHAMLGLSLGPVTGRLAAQLIDEEPLAMDIAMLSPDRFS